MAFTEKSRRVDLQLVAIVAVAFIVGALRGHWRMAIIFVGAALVAVLTEHVWPRYRAVPLSPLAFCVVLVAVVAGAWLLA